MKRLFLILLACASVMLWAAAGLAEETNNAATDLRALVTKIQTKLRDGQKSEAQLADELKEFDALLAKYKGQKTDDAAQILFMKAQLYLEVFQDKAKGDALIAQLKQDYPDSKFVAMLKRRDEGMQIQADLVAGKPFPDFSETSVSGKPLSVANYKGKIVLVDFWATWCGPCVGELPNVLETYQKHHGEGFEIIGISLDQDRDKLTSFTKEKGMTWEQYFDGKGWESKLATKYGVQAIPATFLLDRNGKIIGKDLRGEALESAVKDALAAK